MTNLLSLIYSFPIVTAFDVLSTSVFTSTTISWILWIIFIVRIKKTIKDSGFPPPNKQLAIILNYQKG